MAIPNGFKIINLNNIKNYYYISEIGEVYSTYSNKILNGHKVIISDTIYQIVEPEKS